jgi:hypothetical protein
MIYQTIELFFTLEIRIYKLLIILFTFFNICGIIKEYNKARRLSIWNQCSGFGWELLLFPQ